MEKLVRLIGEICAQFFESFAHDWSTFWRELKSLDVGVRVRVMRFLFEHMRDQRAQQVPTPKSNLLYGVARESSVWISTHQWADAPVGQLLDNTNPHEFPKHQWRRDICTTADQVAKSLLI